jgi:hypothetical protein
LVLFLIIPCLFFAGAVFGSKTFVGTDIQSFFYPFKVADAQMLRSGSFNLWNPYIFAGLPKGGEIATGYFYPLNLIYAIIPVFKATAFFIVFHLFLMALFTYMYLREIRLSKAASVFGALAFTYSGYSLMHVDQLSMLAGGAWLPAILFLIERAFKEKGPFYMTLAALAVSAQILAGHPQVFVISCFAIVFYVIYKLYNPVARKDFAAIKMILGKSFFALIIGIALASFALMPFIEAQFHSMRAAAGIEESSMVHVSPREMQTFLIPELRELASQTKFFGGTGETYAGIVPVFLAAFAVFFVRRKLTFFYLALGVFAVLVSLGKAAPLHYILYYSVPFYGMLQIPIRFLFLYTLSVSVLSAISVDHLSKSVTGLKSYSKWMVVIAASAFVLYLLFAALPETRNFLINVTEGGLRAPFIFILILGA